MLPRLLLIQSHVVHGYVGNRASTFPLQCQGWDVDVLNTVHFSNHTGYGQVEGTSATAEEVEAVYRGLCAIGCRYDAVLTGYVPGAAGVAAVGLICQDVKRTAPECVWLLDPVMGDEGQLYVLPEVVPAYQKILALRMVDIVTPNQFELELLVGFAVRNVLLLKRALACLHEDYGVKHVVVLLLLMQFPSVATPQGTPEPGTPAPPDPRVIYTVVLQADEPAVRLFLVPYIDLYFTGVGDLFLALLLDRVYRAKGGDLAGCVSEVLSVMHQVLVRTHQLVCEEVGSTTFRGEIGLLELMKHCELRIVQCAPMYSASARSYEPRLI